MKNLKYVLLYIFLFIIFEIGLGWKGDVFIMGYVNVIIAMPILWLLVAVISRNDELENEIDNTIPNKIFHSILVKGLKNSEYSMALNDENWDWEIKDLGNNEYIIDGVHPIAKRIIIRTEFIYKPI